MTTDTFILVVDDQPDLLDQVELTLVSAGYHVWTARDGTQALQVLEAQPVDLILADISMPRMNGYQLYERVTENPHWVAIPFLFLTARTLDSDVRYGKALGVDDYLTKPIEPEDLLAAVQGKLRRARQLARSAEQTPASLPLKPDTLSLGRLLIDLSQHRVRLNEQPIRLSAREFKLLECLARQANTVIPLQELIKDTHGLDTDRADASVLLRPLVRTLRRKLGYRAGEMGCIEAVRGVGYRLIPLHDG
jgi:DNA-binding response OmpR family regulator